MSGFPTDNFRPEYSFLTPNRISLNLTPWTFIWEKFLSVRSFQGGDVGAVIAHGIFSRVVRETVAVEMFPFAIKSVTKFLTISLKPVALASELGKPYELL